MLNKDESGMENSYETAKIGRKNDNRRKGSDSQWENCLADQRN